MVFEAYQDELTGLDRIGGKTLTEQEGVYREPIFATDKPCQISIAVSPGSVLTKCDGKTVLQWQGDSKELSFGPEEPAAKVSSPRSLFLDAHRHRYRITKLTYTPLPEPDEAASATTMRRRKTNGQHYRGYGRGWKEPTVVATIAVSAATSDD